MTKIKYQNKEYEVAQWIRDCSGFPIGAVIKLEDGTRKVLDEDDYEVVVEE